MHILVTGDIQEQDSRLVWLTLRVEDKHSVTVHSEEREGAVPLEDGLCTSMADVGGGH